MRTQQQTRFHLSEAEPEIRPGRTQSTSKLQLEISARDASGSGCRSDRKIRGRAARDKRRAGAQGSASANDARKARLENTAGTGATLDSQPAFPDRSLTRSTISARWHLR